jgi:hypothetical protein
MAHCCNRPLKLFFVRFSALSNGSLLQPAIEFLSVAYWVFVSIFDLAKSLPRQVKLFLMVYLCKASLCIAGASLGGSLLGMASAFLQTAAATL